MKETHESWMVTRPGGDECGVVPLCIISTPLIMDQVGGPVPICIIWEFCIIEIEF